MDFLLVGDVAAFSFLVVDIFLGCLCFLTGEAARTSSGIVESGDRLVLLVLRLGEPFNSSPTDFSFSLSFGGAVVLSDSTSLDGDPLGRRPLLGDFLAGDISTEGRLFLVGDTIDFSLGDIDLSLGDRPFLLGDPVRLPAGDSDLSLAGRPLLLGDPVRLPAGDTDLSLAGRPLLLGDPVKLPA